MPSVSQKQRKLMAAAANSPEFRKKVGISKDVATEFHNADRKKARFQEGGEVRDRQRSSEGRTIIREPGREPRVYDPYEEIRRKYQTPGTVIRGDELPNSRPASRPNMEENRVKRMAKGGKAGCGHGMMGGGKVKRYAEGGKVDDREVIDFTGEELDRIEKRAAAYGVKQPKYQREAARGHAGGDAWINQIRKGKSRGAADDAEAVMSRQNYAAGGTTGRAYGMRQRDNLDDFPELRMRKGETVEGYNERQYKAERAGKVPSWNSEMRDDYEMETGRKPRGKAYAAGGQVCRGMGAAMRGGKYKS